MKNLFRRFFLLFKRKSKWSDVVYTFKSGPTEVYVDGIKEFYLDPDGSMRKANNYTESEKEEIRKTMRW